MPHPPLTSDNHPLRNSERVQAVIEVEIEKVGSPPVHAWATDISESGLFLQTTMALAVNDCVSLRFVLQGAQIIIAKAEVSRVRPFEPINVTGEMPGAAVSFADVSALDKARLRRFVRDSLPGDDLNDTLPPGLLAADTGPEREATLPLHLAGGQMRAERRANGVAKANRVASGDVTPASVARFAEIVTSLPTIDSDDGAPIVEDSAPMVRTWSVAPQAAQDFDNPSHLSSLRPLSLPPSGPPAESSAEADADTDAMFASLDRELNAGDTAELSALDDDPTPIDPHDGFEMAFEARATETNAFSAKAEFAHTTPPLDPLAHDDSVPPEAFNEAIDYGRAQSWTYVFVARATPLPDVNTVPPRETSAEQNALAPAHVPTDLPDVLLRTETLPGAPADEVLGLESEIPMMPPPNPLADALALDATRPEIPSQKPQAADLDITAKVIRDDVINTPHEGLLAADAPGQSVSGLWYAGAADIEERLADGRSLPPGVVFDDGDANYIASIPPQDSDADIAFGAFGDDDPFESDDSLGPLNNRTAEHLFRTGGTNDLLRWDDSMGHVTPSVLGDVDLSESEVAFADRLSDDIDDAISADSAFGTNTPSARNRRSDALISEIFGDDTSANALPSRPLSTDSTDLGLTDSSGAFSLGDVPADSDAFPDLLDRSIECDEANVFTPALASEMTARIRRKRQAPWRAVAVSAIAIGATGLGVGLALMDGDAPAPRAPTQQIASPNLALNPVAMPASVADIERPLGDRRAPAVTTASKKPAPAAPMPQAQPPKAAPQKVATAKPTPAAPKPAPAPAASLQAPATPPTPAASPSSTNSAPKIERGRVTVALTGGKVVKKFALQNPPRLVVDLVGAEFPGGGNIDIQKEGVARIRFGQLNAETVRFVVELSGDRKPRNLSVLKRQSELAVAWQ